MSITLSKALIAVSTTVFNVSWLSTSKLPKQREARLQTTKSPHFVFSTIISSPSFDLIEVFQFRLLHLYFEQFQYKG